MDVTEKSGGKSGENRNLNRKKNLRLQNLTHPFSDFISLLYMSSPLSLCFLPPAVQYSSYFFHNSLFFFFQLYFLFNSSCISCSFFNLHDCFSSAPLHLKHHISPFLYLFLLVLLTLLLSFLFTNRCKKDDKWTLHRELHIAPLSL